MQRLIAPLLSALLFFLANLNTCSGIKCLKSIKVNNTLEIGECEGDACAFQNMSVAAGVFLGCLTGYDSMKVGCTKDSVVHSCICNDHDYCNGNVTIKKFEEVQEIECYRGKVTNGKLEGNNTCKGRTCLLSSSLVLDGTGLEVFAACGDSTTASPRFGIEKGCFLISFDEQSSHDTWDCNCNTKLCNSPSAFNIPKRSKNVMCLATTFNSIDDKGIMVAENSTCTGDFCVTSPFAELLSSKTLYTQGCASFSGGAEMKPKLFRYDIERENEVYFCNEVNCNKDIATAAKSIAKTHGSKG